MTQRRRTQHSRRRRAPARQTPPTTPPTTAPSLSIAELEAAIAPLRDRVEARLAELEREGRRLDARTNQNHLQTIIRDAAIAAGVRRTTIDYVVSCALDTWRLADGNLIAERAGNPVFSTRDGFSLLSLTEWFDELRGEQSFLFHEQEHGDDDV